MLAAVGLMVSACAPAVKINYSLNSVPEEGGIRFTRITTDADNVTRPEIVPVKAQGLAYYVRNPFDLSPDGKTLAFVGVRGEKANVFLKSTEGAAATTQRTFRDIVHDVAYSPDGGKLAFSDNRNGQWNVFEISAEGGSAIRQITNFSQVSIFPEYSPVAGTLMYVQYERSAVGVSANGTTVGTVPTTRYYIWGVDLERGAHTQYAEGYAPALSPDGQKLAITRDSRDHGNSEIWVVDLRSGAETLIVSSETHGYMQPVFSPDGQKLVFTAVTLADRSRPTNLDVFTIGVDGSNQTQLTFHPGHDMMARFSPDGRSIYFLSQRGSDRGSWNIWRMDFAG